MKLLTTTAVGLLVLAASATSVSARDYYSVGINVDNYGARSYGYNSAYSIGYSNRPRVIYEPTVVYYGAPTRYYEPVVVYQNNRGCADNRRSSYGQGYGGYNGGGHHGRGHGHHGWR